MNKGIFITGTDTGVGKTYIACSIASAIRKMSISVGVMKPVCTGNRLDAKKLIRSAKVRDSIDNVNPIFLKHPLAPLVSARISNKNIDMNNVWASFERIQNKYDFTIVEGVGGLEVPIKPNYSVVDLIKDYSLPVLIVARPCLGTINHTLLTVKRLKDKKIKVMGVIFSGLKKSGLAEKTNPQIIKELTGLPLVEVHNKKQVNLEENLWIIGKN